MDRGITKSKSNIQQLVPASILAYFHLSWKMLIEKAEYFSEYILS